MPNLATLVGSLSTVPDDTVAVPVGSEQFTLSTTPDPKPFAVKVDGVRVCASGSYVTLGSIGAGQDVANVSLLVMKTSAAMQIRVTQAAATQEHTVLGTLILEVPDTTPITLVEVKGTGTVEYFASGLT